MQSTRGDLSRKLRAALRYWFAVAVAVLGVSACASKAAPDGGVLALQVELVLESTSTVTGLGAGQGATALDERVYLYGDGDTGVLRGYTLSPEGTALEATGGAVVLTVDGVDIIPHPTGLASDPLLGDFLGNTVGGRGTIYHIDLERALRQGTLDGAVLNRVEDDLAVNGCRPEYVRFQGRWLIATADYGERGNRVRLYDPGALAVEGRTSDAGVLVASFPCGAWVQSLEWVDDLGVLVLVQNQVEGLLYRLTACRFEEGASGAKGLVELGRVDLETPRDELEGFALLGGGRFVMVSSSREGNVHLGTVRLTAGERR